MSQTITVRRTENSTPNRGWDYSAVYGDYDLGNPIGHGATPNEAIADLEEMRVWRAIGGLDVQ
jgi:hypothetical protein